MRKTDRFRQSPPVVGGNFPQPPCSLLLLPPFWISEILFSEKEDWNLGPAQVMFSLGDQFLKPAQFQERNWLSRLCLSSSLIEQIHFESVAKGNKWVISKRDLAWALGSSLWPGSSPTINSSPQWVCWLSKQGPCLIPCCILSTQMNEWIGAILTNILSSLFPVEVSYFADYL